MEAARSVLKDMKPINQLRVFAAVGAMALLPLAASAQTTPAYSPAVTTTATTTATDERGEREEHHHHYGWIGLLGLLGLAGLMPRRQVVERRDTPAARTDHRPL